MSGFNPNLAFVLVEGLGRAAFNPDALAQLILQLELSHDRVPQIIADAISQNPKLQNPLSVFPGRLIYGVMARVLEEPDANKRLLLLKRFSKQIERIQNNLLHRGCSEELIQAFSDRLDELCLGCRAVNDLACKRSFSNAELSALAERIVVAGTFQPHLMRSLISKILTDRGHDAARRYSQRMRSVLKDALSNPPWDDDGGSTVFTTELHGPVQFRKTALDDPFFVQAAKEMQHDLVNGNG